jgi:hypothetical protein
MSNQTEIIDTEVPVSVVEDALAPFREQAKAELEETDKRSKMSDTAVAKLRALNEQTKAQEILDERFASALRLIIPTDSNLLTLLDRCNRSVRLTQIERRAEKLAWWVAAGYRLGHEINGVTMLNFFSTLVDEEHTMSASKFTSLWNLAVAAKLKESRMTRGLIDSGIPEVRPCKSGKKCLRFEKRKPAAAQGNGAYCSTACSASDRARVKRALAAIPTGPDLN